MLNFQAYASAKFADATLRALQGHSGIIECAFVASQVWIQKYNFKGVNE